MRATQYDLRLGEDTPLVLIVGFRSLYELGCGRDLDAGRTASRAFSKRIPSDLGASFRWVAFLFGDLLTISGARSRDGLRGTA
jgi:hypothetical protein